MKEQTIIFYGRSGSGKGTQSLLLQDFLHKHDPVNDVLYIETGSGIRALAAKETYTGRMIKNVYDHGGLMPEVWPIWAWGSYLIDSMKEHTHVLFDGICRRLPEAPILDSALSFYKRDPRTVVVINVSREEAVMRLKLRGRSDDNEEEIKNRLDWYDENVVPAINYFRNNPAYTVLEINGEQAREDVLREIVEGLGIT